MVLPKRVKLVEVGPRDGLQGLNERVPLAVKVEFVNLLSAAGLKTVEVGSLVSSKRVPQMADSVELFREIDQGAGCSYPLLIATTSGLKRALGAGVSSVAIFTTVSDSFAKANLNATVADSLENCRKIAALARRHGLVLRAYISCAFGSPYRGEEVGADQVAKLSRALWAMGCGEISLADTLGAAVAPLVRRTLRQVKKEVPQEALACHFHDTFARGLVNVYAAMEEEIAIFDCSAAGLGGCPFMKGAGGNVATEALLSMLHGMGVETGVDPLGVLRAADFINQFLGRPPGPRFAPPYL